MDPVLVALYIIFIRHIHLGMPIYGRIAIEISDMISTEFQDTGARIIAAQVSESSAMLEKAMDIRLKGRLRLKGPASLGRDCRYLRIESTCVCTRTPAYNLQTQEPADRRPGQRARDFLQTTSELIDQVNIFLKGRPILLSSANRHHLGAFQSAD